MYSDAELALTYKFANAPLMGFPYPHFFVRDIFPTEFYDRLQANIPDPSLMIPIEQARDVKGYKERFVLEIGKAHHQTLLPPGQREFWSELSEWLCGRFTNLVISKLQPFIQPRFGTGPLPPLYSEAMLVEDIVKTNNSFHGVEPVSDPDTKRWLLLFDIYVQQQPIQQQQFGNIQFKIDASLGSGQKA